MGCTLQWLGRAGTERAYCWAIGPAAAPRYLLQRYADHLERSGAPPARFYALISNGWRQAWEVLDSSNAGFLYDVGRAWQKAKQRFDPAQPGKALVLVQQIKATLCQASVAALGSKMLPELLAQALQSELRTPVQALAIAKLAPTDEKRAALFSALAPYLPVALLGEALNAARAIQYDGYRVRALSSLAAHLPAALLGEALNAARTIRHESSRTSALSSLAQPLADWSHGAAKPAYGAWVESLPVLAARPRPEFLQDLATLMPFTLALAGDEA